MSLRAGVLIFSVSIAGCANVYNVGDPRGVAVRDVLKSIRCEAVTFLSINRQRKAKFAAAFRKKESDAFRFEHLDIDDGQFGGVYVELKNVDSVEASLGLTANNPSFSQGKSLTWFFGPSVGVTNTFTLEQNFALPQNASLSESEPSTGRYPVHPDFRCYDAPYRDQDAEGLLQAERPAARFERILVDGKKPLASWLLDIGAEMSTGYLGGARVTNFLAPGQIAYTFALDVKPGLDLKYNFIGSYLAPISAEAKASRENTSSFTLLLNTNYSGATATARSGGAGITDATITEIDALISRGAAATARRRAPGGGNAERGETRQPRRLPFRTLFPFGISASPPGSR